MAPGTNVSTAVSQQAMQSSTTTLSLFVGVVVSFLSAILVYSARQFWERRKLKRALLTEIEQMEGINKCANQMSRIDSPPARQLSADDVPAEGSIPTTVYQSTASKIGLLGRIRAESDLKGAVKFYSKVMRYKSIIREVGQQRVIAQNQEGNSINQTPISDSDQEDLYNNIDNLSEVRDRIIETESFDVEYPDDIE